MKELHGYSADEEMSLEAALIQIPQKYRQKVIDTKELFLLDGATHIQTYWKPEYVNQAVAKLVGVFGENLK